MDKKSPVGVIEMALPVEEAINRRAHERKYFNQKVRWTHKSDEDISTDALDMSPWGMFVSNEGKMMRHLKNNDPVIISIDIGVEHIELNGKIRWAGTSGMHDKPGFGIEFDNETKALAEELMLQLDEQGVFFVPE